MTKSMKTHRTSMNPYLKPLLHASNSELSRIKAVFFDIDDTFSTHGKIYAEAYDALWKLFRAGIKVVPVTGRPAGWCDMISRMWPVHAVVGENGAFYSHLTFKAGHTMLVKKYLETESVRKANQKKLQDLHKKILKKFPKAQTASDQFCREFDLAIDYCEDVNPWTDDEVKELIFFCEDEGAQVKLSSIHVNIWFGKYDKLTCVEKVLKHRFEIKSLKEVIYIGDSPNDEPFFKEFPVTVGVANLMNFVGKLDYFPKYLTKRSCGQGFSELAHLLIAAR